MISAWSSPLGRWLRGLVDDPGSTLPSLARVIETVRLEFEKTRHLGILYVRLQYWGEAERLLGWEELAEAYERLSHVTIDLMGKGLRRVDLPADLGLRGEGFAIVLSAPRETGRLDLAVVDGVGERFADAILGYSTGSLSAELLDRLSVGVGSSIVNRPELNQTLEDVLVAGLVEAESAAQMKHERRLAELAGQLETAFEVGDVGVLYQPVVDLASSRVMGFDAVAQGPQFLNLRPGDVFFDVAHRTGLAYRAYDLYHEAALSSAAGSVEPLDTLMVRTTASDLLESAVRMMALLYRRPDNALTPGSIVFMVGTAQMAAHFPSTLAAFRSVADMGFKLGLEADPQRSLPLDYMRELQPHIVRIGGRLVRGLHRRQDEFELVLMLSRFTNRHGIRLLAAGCAERAEVLALQRAGVPLAQGDYFASYLGRPTRPEIDIP